MICNAPRNKPHIYPALLDLLLFSFSLHYLDIKPKHNITNKTLLSLVQYRNWNQFSFTQYIILVKLTFLICVKL